MTDRPMMLQTVLDATDIRTLAEFYRELMQLTYRPGDEQPDDGADDADWLVLEEVGGRRLLAFQRVAQLVPSTWPDPSVPQQLHLDLCVPTAEALARYVGLAQSLGARVLLDRSGDADEPLYVLADPAGHPFCLFVKE